MLAYNTTLADFSTKSTQYALGINTEIISHHEDGLLSGININTSPSFFRCQIDAAISANQHTFYFFLYHNLILEIDVNSKSFVAKLKKN